VASEKVVTALPFGMVLVSASLPRKPMSSTLLRYIFFSPFVPICLGRPKDAWSPLQAPTEVDFFGQTVGGTKTFRLESTRERRRAWEFDPKRSRDSERGRRQCTATLVEPLAIWRVDGDHSSNGTPSTSSRDVPQGDWLRRRRYRSTCWLRRRRRIRREVQAVRALPRSPRGYGPVVRGSPVRGRRGRGDADTVETQKHGDSDK
jgi:hypothetical protein